MTPRLSTAVDRILGNFQRDLDAAVRPSPVAPGMDREGAPPLSELATLEQEARHRLSPRKNPWRDVAEFDERVAGSVSYTHLTLPTTPYV